MNTTLVSTTNRIMLYDESEVFTVSSPSLPFLNQGILHKPTGSIYWNLISGHTELIKHAAYTPKLFRWANTMRTMVVDQGGVDADVVSKVTGAIADGCIHRHVAKASVLLAWVVG